MRYVLLLFVVSGLFCSTLHAEPKAQNLGFKYIWDAKTKTGICQNSNGEMGLNPHFIGPCGDLRGLKLLSQDLNGRKLQGAVFDGVNMKGVRLNGADLRGVHAHGANMTRAHLNGADLRGANLNGVVFRRAKLSGANLSHTDLSGANLEDSQLHGTQFFKANLSGAIIDADLKTANLAKSTITIGTKLPFKLATALKRGMSQVSEYKAFPVEKRTPSSETKKSE